jgi:hypothetical protein
MTETECVYCAVRTVSLCITPVTLGCHKDSVCTCCMDVFGLFNCKFLAQVHNSALFKNVLSTFS